MLGLQAEGGGLPHMAVVGPVAEQKLPVIAIELKLGIVRFVFSTLNVNLCTIELVVLGINFFISKLVRKNISANGLNKIALVAKGLKLVSPTINGSATMCE